MRLAIPCFLSSNTIPTRMVHKDIGDLLSKKSKLVSGQKPDCTKTTRKRVVAWRCWKTGDSATRISGYPDKLSNDRAEGCCACVSVNPSTIILSDNFSSSSNPPKPFDIADLRVHACAHLGKLCGQNLTSRPKKIEKVDIENGSPFYIVLILEKLLTSKRVFLDDQSLSQILFLINGFASLFSKYQKEATRCKIPTD